MKLAEFENRMNQITFKPLYDDSDLITMKVKLEGHFNYQIVGIDEQGTEHPYGIVSKYYPNKFNINFTDDYTEDNLFYDAPDATVQEIMKLIYKFTNTPISQREPRDLSEYRIEQSENKFNSEREAFLNTKEQYLAGDFEEHEDDFDDDPDDYVDSDDYEPEEDDEEPYSDSHEESHTDKPYLDLDLDDLFKGLFKDDNNQVNQSHSEKLKESSNELEDFSRIFIKMLGEALKNSSNSNDTKK
ncbi:MAG TPA: hypothetical protein K8V88_08870 [Companilactobacillus farciminis]|uniref:Uncharacterized protein n=1 Tax=Companilactobacillus farciminis TaxID=1612 RepID=A0A921HSC4_9LACO|nr:hypothetical protein [Companilactobacillus farciminis]